MVSKNSIKRKISPPIKDLSFLRQPLNEGELKVFKFLHLNLPQEWEIYIQPHLNGLCPDFVILNPNVGIQIIEVKDWNLSSLDWKWEQYNPKSLTLRCKGRGGKSFIQPDPYNILKLYREEILDIYCSRSGVQLAEKYRNYFPVLSQCIAMPSESSDAVKEFLKKPFEKDQINKEDQLIYWPIISYDVLNKEQIEVAVPFITRKSSKYMTEETASDLRNWLEEPIHKENQRKPLELDRVQKRLATQRTQSGFRRIKGAAGSGKSIVLAKKASLLSLENKNILILCFNLTLCNYLRDLIVRGALDLPTKQILKNITIIGYHQWVKRFMYQQGKQHIYDQIWFNLFSSLEESNLSTEERKKLREEVLNKELPNALNNIVKELKKSFKKYDAILIDEGQDYRLNWWPGIRGMIDEPKGEIFLVADSTQNIYGTAEEWTEKAMKGAGFRGEWNTLEKSYRIPPDFIPFIRDFGEIFLPKKGRFLPIARQQELGLTNKRWIQTDEGNLNKKCVEEITRHLPKEKDKFSFSEVIFLASNKKSGMEVVNILNSDNFNIKVTHTFSSDDKKNKREKMSFFLGRETVKASTIHSFKGWESPVLVIQISNMDLDIESAQVYTSLTRLLISPQQGSYISVICSNPKYAQYGESWERA